MFLIQVLLNLEFLGGGRSARHVYSFTHTFAREAGILRLHAANLRFLSIRPPFKLRAFADLLDPS